VSNCYEEKGEGMKNKLIEDYTKLILYYERMINIENFNNQSLLNHGENVHNRDIAIAVSETEIIKLKELKELCIQIVADYKKLEMHSALGILRNMLHNRGFVTIPGLVTGIRKIIADSILP